MIDRLKQEHDRIRTLCATLEVHLGKQRPPSEPDFARCRWELMRELALHLACERRALSDPARKAQAHALVRTTDQALDDALRAHMLDWTGEAIQKEWCRYRFATRTLLRRLEQRMSYEERAIFPLLQ